MLFNSILNIKVTVIVEAIRNVCGICITTKYAELLQYNLRQYQFAHGNKKDFNIIESKVQETIECDLSDDVLHDKEDNEGRAVGTSTSKDDISTTDDNIINDNSRIMLQEE